MHGWAVATGSLPLSAEAYRPTGSCLLPAGRMQHGAVSVLWRQISQRQRLGGVRTASQRNSYFGGIALEAALLSGLKQSLPVVSEPLPQVCHCPVDSDVVVHLPQSCRRLPHVGKLRLAVVQLQLGPTESMVCHFGRWLAGGQVLV